ncbi:MAG TPA: enolase C-terminal domain-like protein [Pirellulales bacterium]|jgi:O-succinylbenzoate synthase|nr:enolase C-terminal domain-like protein [Pirellulales bacterium]
MRIDSVELFRVPFERTRSAADSLESVIAVVHSGALVGLGEATLSCGPTHGPEWSAAAFLCLRDWLAPAILGREVDSGGQLQQHLVPYAGNAAAKSALDIAWWNLSAARAGQPLSQVVGARQAEVHTGQTFGLAPSIDELLSNIQAALDTGCPLVTLKLRPGWDLQVVRAVRQSFPNAPLAVDCQASCTLAEMDTFYRLEDFFLAEIIDPLSVDDLVAHAMLKQAIRTPLVLERSLTSVARLEQMIDLDCCHKLRINLARVGGLTPALEIARACSDAKLPWSVASDPAGEVAVGAAIALAARCDSQTDSSIPEPIPYGGSGGESQRGEPWRFAVDFSRKSSAVQKVLASQVAVLERAHVGV